MSGSSRKIADIEILRALAVVFVVVHHVNGNLFERGQLFGEFMSRYFGGWVGVDLFFAISGFVIARTLLPVLAASTDGKKYRRATFIFWGRRAFRLLPSAWLWLGIILLLQIFFNESGVFGGLRENLWATLAGVFNFANFRFADAFGTYPYGVSFVYWSLSLEEQFYLLLPLLFFISRKYFPLLLFLIVVWQIPQERGLMGMVIRSDAIGLGVLIAIFSHTEVYRRIGAGRSKLRTFLFASVIMACLVALPVVGSIGQQQLSFQLGLIAVLSAIVVFCCSFDTDLLARYPGSRLLVWLGSRSYAIYLIHIPVFFAVRELAFRLEFSLQEKSYLVLFFALGLVLVLAELNFRLIESPAQRFSRRLF